jgi:hypothetical protein
MPAGKTVFAKIGNDAVKAKTGKSWTQWFKILDRLDPKSNGHRHAVMSLYHKYKLNPWWSQAVTIRYEWERGLRTIKNQRQAMPGHALFKNRPKKRDKA